MYVVEIVTLLFSSFFEVSNIEEILDQNVKTGSQGKGNVEDMAHLTLVQGKI